MRARRRSYWRESDARRALAEVERRGETDVAFERRTGIPVSRLRWWRKRLRAVRPDPMALLPVQVVRSKGSEADSIATSFEVVVGERVVRVPPGFDDDALRRLVRALEQS
jgi:hypothetical protein